MIWAITVFSCFTVLVSAALFLFTFIYVKEFKREEKILQDLKNDKEKFYQMPIVLTPLPATPKKKKKPIVEDAVLDIAFPEKKKNIN